MMSKNISVFRNVISEWCKNVIIGASDEGNVNKTLFSMIKQFNMNAVFIDQFIEDEDVSCVSVNNEEGGYLAARHLIELGHKNWMYCRQ